MEDPDYRGEFYLVDNAGEAEFSRFSPNKIVLDVQVRAADTLVLNQNNCTDWWVRTGIERSRHYPTKVWLHLMSHLDNTGSLFTIFPGVSWSRQQSARYLFLFWVYNLLDQYLSEPLNELPFNSLEITPVQQCSLWIICVGSELLETFIFSGALD